MLAFVPSNDINLINLYGPSQFRRGGCSHHALPKLPRQLLGIVFVDSQFVSDLAVAQIQPHQVQPCDPHSERLMMARKHSACEIVELLLTPQTAVSLSGPLMLVTALFGDLVRVAVGTPHAFWPAMDPDDLKTLGVVQQVKQVHGQPILPFSTQLPETQEEPGFIWADKATPSWIRWTDI